MTAPTPHAPRQRSPELDRPEVHPSPHVLDAALKRRAELWDTVRDLNRTLASPSPGREAVWTSNVSAALEELRKDIVEHVETTEATDGIYDEIRAAAPRLINQVDRLIKDHEVMQARIDACCALAAEAAQDPATMVKVVRDDATEVVALLQRHRQRGSDLVFEAFETDIGGGE